MGVLKAGVAMVPLDHSHPVIRLNSITENPGVELLLCSPSQRELLEQTGIAIFVFNAILLDNISLVASTT